MLQGFAPPASPQGEAKGAYLLRVCRMKWLIMQYVG